jgi:S1-C subfamily serine protease
MRKTILLCGLSTAAGVLLASLIRLPDPQPLVTAQVIGKPVQSDERRVPRSPESVGDNRARARFVPPEQRLSPVDVDSREAASELTPAEIVTVAVYEKVNMSVVNIATKAMQAESFFFEVPSEGSGSGSVLDREGRILTNFHVIDGAQEVTVTLYNGESFPARMVGNDRANDVAVIQIDAPRELLHPVTFGDSSRLRVGQNAYAIGNPFGLDRTLTTGVISSLNRKLPGRTARTLKSIIQLDAAINPGNSGGPLLDSRGRLIGINTAIASRTGQSSGVGFAIPINTVARIVPQLIQHGHVIRADAGIVAVEKLKLGLRIAKLVEGGPAELAGLRGWHVERKRRGPFVQESIDRKAADVILAVDGKAIESVDELLTQIESKQPDETVTLTVAREGRQVDVLVRLREGE